MMYWLQRQGLGEAVGTVAPRSHIIYDPNRGEDKRGRYYIHPTVALVIFPSGYLYAKPIKFCNRATIYASAEFAAAIGRSLSTGAREFVAQ